MTTPIPPHSLPRPLIEGPSAWVGADLARRPEDWTYRLSAAEIAEIEHAAAGIRARGLDLGEITRADFPLPGLGPTLDRFRDEILNRRGFVLVRGFPVTGRALVDNAAVFLGIGSYLGHVRSQNAMGHILGHVRDLGLATADPNVRTYQTTERQHFHTDSCDIVGLLCLKTAKSGGLSSIVSSMAIYNELTRRRPDLLPRLFAPFPTDRRGEVPEGKQPYFELPVYSDYAGYLSAIYSRTYINSAQRFPDARRLSPEDVEALDLFDDLANHADLRLDMQLQPGDMQFLHNHTILHDRTAYVDWPDPENKRHLLRLWLAAPGARPLPAIYAERYGSVTVGDRGGIIVPGTRLNVPVA
ncbi:MAG: TauD/TfdA family dioxygenase [Alphaproteobacteria bacterium]|nr:TauD/TfdA family dioxygenase [Alphaproteobacteria bacterium]